MDVSKLFTETFNEKLVQKLPMKDAIFLSKLATRGLFPGDLKGEVDNAPTRAKAAIVFITSTAENGDTDSFSKLLSAMKEYSPALKTLAESIEAKFPGTQVV